jgi:hypothetical protein
MVFYTMREEIFFGCGFYPFSVCGLIIELNIRVGINFKLKI